MHLKTFLVVIASLLASSIMSAFSETGAASLLIARDGKLQVVWPQVRELAHLDEVIVSNSFAVGPDETLLYASGSCRGPHHLPAIHIKNRAGKSKVFQYAPARLFPEFGTDYQFFSISSRSRYAAFVVTSCPDMGTLSASRGELGYVSIVDLKSGQIKAAKDSLDAGGVPIGRALHTSFSPDEKMLLVNYETGFLIFDVTTGKKLFSMDELGIEKQPWTNALGWLSNGCLAYTAGANESTARKQPAKVIHWKTGVVDELAILFPQMDKFSTNIEMIRFPFAVQVLDQAVRVVSLESGMLSTLRLRTLPEFLYLMDSGRSIGGGRHTCSD